mmetsp:Transcript_13469/g.38511  ORF Transcript_13469/g.38511 Transcript_13469/m.38511 type:complete len:437 (+) Transcript_13469:1424-2734(+)
MASPCTLDLNRCLVFLKPSRVFLGMHPLANHTLRDNNIDERVEIGHVATVASERGLNCRCGLDLPESVHSTLCQPLPSSALGNDNIGNCKDVVGKALESAPGALNFNSCEILPHFLVVASCDIGPPRGLDFRGSKVPHQLVSAQMTANKSLNLSGRIIVTLFAKGRVGLHGHPATDGTLSNENIGQRVQIVHGAIIRTPGRLDFSGGKCTLFVAQLCSLAIRRLPPGYALDNNNVDNVELIAELRRVRPPRRLNHDGLLMPPKFVEHLVHSNAGNASTHDALQLRCTVMLILQRITGNPAFKGSLDLRGRFRMQSQIAFRSPTPHIALNANQGTNSSKGPTLRETSPHFRLDRDRCRRQEPNTGTLNRIEVRVVQIRLGQFLRHRSYFARRSHRAILQNGLWLFSLLTGQGAQTTAGQRSSVRSGSTPRFRRNGPR